MQTIKPEHKTQQYPSLTYKTSNNTIEPLTLSRHTMASPIRPTPRTNATTPNLKLTEEPAEEASAGKSLLSPLSLSSPAAPDFVLSVFGEAPLAFPGAGAGASLGSTRSSGRSTLSTWYMASLLSV